MAVRRKPEGRGIAARQSLRRGERLLDAPCEDLHLFAGLLVPPALGDRDAGAIGGERFGWPRAVGERTAERLPCRRVLGVQRHRLPQMPGGPIAVADLQILDSERKAQQRAVAPRGQHALEIHKGG